MILMQLVMFKKSMLEIMFNKTIQNQTVRIHVMLNYVYMYTIVFILFKKKTITLVVKYLCF